jgi:hypothetical protein
MSRAEKALEILKAGGYFRKQLETQYRGGEKFVYRLHAAGGAVVHGIGFQTWAALEKAGKLKRLHCFRSSVWPSEWTVADEIEELA